MTWVTKDSTETYNQTPEPPREYTKTEKAANWWHYHWGIVVIVVLCAFFGIWIIKDTVFQTRPDVQVAYVGTHDLRADTVTALQDALTPFCEDTNGDGKVVVQVDTYNVDFDADNVNTDAYNQMTGVTRLSAELSSGGKTYIFLLEDPAAFESSTVRCNTWTAPCPMTPTLPTPIGPRWSTAGPTVRCWPDWNWATTTATPCWTTPPARTRACWPPCMWGGAASGMKSRQPSTRAAPSCGTP